MDDEASAVTFRKSAPGGPGGPGGPEAEPVEEDLPVSTMPVEEEEDLPVSTMPVAEPEPAPEADYPSSNFPELASENQAFMFSEPDCQGESWAVFPLASGERRDIYYQDWEHLVGHDSHDNVASVQVPEHYILTLWQHDFTGAAEAFAGFAAPRLSDYSWGCQNVGTISD